MQELQMKLMKYSQLSDISRRKAEDTYLLEVELFGGIVDREEAQKVLLETDDMYYYDQRGYYLGSKFTIGSKVI